MFTASKQNETSGNPASFDSRMMPGREDKYQWPDHELKFIECELAKEYTTTPTAVISMVVGLAKSMVVPQEGWVKLLALARKNLRR